MILALFTFNLGGHYLVFWVLKKQADNQLSEQLDNSLYKDGETFEIKIPLTLPYPLQQTDFQRQDGEFVYNHEHYRLVKQKHEQDTLTIVCIKNAKANQLASAMDEYSAKTSGDDQPKNGILFSGKVLQEYEPGNAFGIVSSNCWSCLTPSTHLSIDLHSLNLELPSPPPKA